MKKKFKLFASLASLCVAVALLVFGVYAASKVTYTLNNTVTYKFENAFVKVTRVVEKAKAASVAAPITSDAAKELTDSDFEASGIANLEFQTYNANATAWADPSATGLTWDGTKNDASETVNFDLNASYVYRVTITITTPATNGVGLTVAIPASTQTNVYRETGANAYVTEATLAKGAEAKIVYYVGLIDATKSVGENVTLGSGVTVTVNQK